MPYGAIPTLARFFLAASRGAYQLSLEVLGPLGQSANMAMDTPKVGMLQHRGSTGAATRKQSIVEAAEQHLDKNTIILCVNVLILCVLVAILYVGPFHTNRGHNVPEND
jgi:hypothetical protein